MKPVTAPVATFVNESLTIARPVPLEKGMAAVATAAIDLFDGGAPR